MPSIVKEFLIRDSNMHKIKQTIVVKDGQKPLVIYYCKANLKNGNTVRVVNKNFTPHQITDCKGVGLVTVQATMIHENSTGKAKASGAKCVLEVSSGIVHILDL